MMMVVYFMDNKSREALEELMQQLIYAINDVECAILNQNILIEEHLKSLYKKGEPNE